MKWSSRFTIVRTHRGGAFFLAASDTCDAEYVVQFLLFFLKRSLEDFFKNNTMIYL
jgi:hypothetical protein